LQSNAVAAHHAYIQNAWGGKTGTAPVMARGMAAMSCILGKMHFFDRRVLARLNAAIMLGLVGSGLAACAFGAFVYDIGRWFSAW
jgi:hypothetical protein